ncbi:TDRD6 protein, partial [Polyodon spathula]|nr:TDRD6 protein [Polyodon spathula]
MCSTPGLPTPGSSVTVNFTRINLHPYSVLVELWGQFDQERKVEYQRLRREIQTFPKTRFGDAEGSPGDLCLVQIIETWYRARILVRKGRDYHVFLIDEGRTLNVCAYNLAHGRNYFFHLPPEVEFCVLANVVPLSTENKWSPMALEFMKCLGGRTFEGSVQDVLMPHRTFLLDVPCVSKQMFEMGFAKRLSSKTFKFFVERSMQSMTAALSDQESQKLSPSVRCEVVETGDVHENDIGISQDYFYPQLQTEVTEAVVVTEFLSPLRFFCQLRVFSQELKKLTEHMSQFYEGRSGFEKTRPEVLGSPCAARGKDGRWYRSIVQQVLSSKNVEVLHVDYGKKELIPIGSIRNLAAEYFRMPVITYLCSLLGISDHGVGWPAAQIEHLKSLILHRVVNAKFEYHSYSEGVYYVTLYGDESVNINSVFGMREQCFSETKENPLQGQSDNLASAVHSTSVANMYIKTETLGLGCFYDAVVDLLVQKGFAQRAPLKKAPQPPFHLDTYYYSTHNIKTGGEEEIFVTHIKNVGNFYCQLGRNADIVHKLAEKVNYLCKELQRIDCPKTFGTVCFAKYSDGHWYRGQIKSVQPTIQVFFVDYGDTQMVEKSDLLPIPIEASDIMSVPVQAVMCCLSDVPADVPRKVNEWFENAVFGKTLKALVVAKESDGKLIVELYNENTQINANIKAELASFEGVETTFKKAQEPTPMRKETTPTFKSRDEYKARLSSQTRETKPFRGDSGIAKKQQISSPKFEHRVLSLPNLGDLPPKCIAPGEVKEVYVSHSNCPSSFFVQLVQEEGEIYSVVEKLNADQMVATNLDADSLQPDDLVCAEFPDDGSWYRAVLKNKLEDGTLNKDPEMEKHALQYCTYEISPGQTLEAYASSVVGPEYFWCQSANSDVLQRIDEIADAAGNAPEESGVCVGSLCPGNPCLALFTEDEHWYRAEIKRINGDVLSIIFVDYGNEVDVNQELVKLLPAEFLKIPRQAFLCILEGFDLSAGFWDVGAADKFYELLSDKLLKVSVLKCDEHNHGVHLFHVKVESNEAVVNDVMRNYWKMHTAERNEHVNTEHEQQQPIADMLVANEGCPPEEKSQLQRRVTELLSNAEKLKIGTEQSINLPSKTESFTVDETSGDVVRTTYDAVDHGLQASAQKSLPSKENSLSTVQKNAELFSDAGKVQTGMHEECTVVGSDFSHLPSVHETGSNVCQPLDDVLKTFTMEKCEVVSTVQSATKELQTDKQSVTVSSSTDTFQDVTDVNKLSIKLSDEKSIHDVQDVERVFFEENVNNSSSGEKTCPREETEAQKNVLFEECEYLESSIDEPSVNILSSNGRETSTQEENYMGTNTVEINYTVVSHPEYDHVFQHHEDIQGSDTNVRETSTACNILNLSLAEHSWCSLNDVDQQCCIAEGNLEPLVSYDQVEGNDIHEDVLGQLVGSDTAAKEEKEEVVDIFVMNTEIKSLQNQQSKPQECEPDFIGLKLETGDELGVGSDCVVWSYVYKTWCKAQILKVYDETTKVNRLLEDDSYVAETHGMGLVPVPAKNLKRRAQGSIGGRGVCVPNYYLYPRLTTCNPPSDSGNGGWSARPLKRAPANPSFFALRIHSEATRPIMPMDNTDLAATLQNHRRTQPHGSLMGVEPWIPVDLGPPHRGSAQPIVRHPRSQLAVTLPGPEPAIPRL